jgi:N-formylmaleamate deformylase
MRTETAMSKFLYGANVHANGVRQHYLRYGSARKDRDAIILLPGITSPAITWGFVGEQLGRAFDVYILDIRGRGLSEASTGLDYSLDAQAEDATAVAKALGLSRYAIVGHSMGARIAIRAARHHPSGLTRVVLIDPPVSGPGRRPYPANLAWYVDSMAAARNGAGIDAMRDFCPTWTDQQLRLRAEWLHTCDERAVLESFKGFHADDIHADLPHVAVPARLILAARGDVVTDTDVDEIKALCPGIEFARVPDAGHMIPWDNEPGFYRAFEAFLGARVD